MKNRKSKLAALATVAIAGSIISFSTPQSAKAQDGSTWNVYECPHGYNCAPGGSDKCEDPSTELL